MNITINTQALKIAVTKAVKGAGMNRLLPITNMLALVGDVDAKKLLVVTTDGTNTLVVKADCEVEEWFNLVVPVDIFSKLISKTTSETVTLELQDNNLLVKGNGNYKIALPTDEEGLVKFPMKDWENLVADNRADVKLSFVKAIIDTNKASLAKTLEVPCLTGYYVDDGFVISTDENNACYNRIIKMFDGDTLLLGSKTLDLLALTGYENIEYARTEDTIVFSSPDLCLVTRELEGKDIFPVTPLMALYSNSTFASMCKVPKILLQSVIDRLMLFIEPYDKNAATFTFTQNGLQISSKNMSSIELINYTDSQGFEPFIAIVDIVSLKAQIDAYPKEEIEIWYGNQNALKLKSDNITQIISLLEEI